MSMAQCLQMGRDALRAHDGEGGLSGPCPAVFQGKEKGGQSPDVVGVEVGQKQVGNSFPVQTQKGQGSEGACATIQKDGRMVQVNPVSWWSSFRIGN